MKILSVDYDDKEMPESATFRLSITEMAYLTKLLGNQSGTLAEQTMRGGMSVDCYSPLARLFMSHWEDGVDDYLRERL